MAKPSRIRRWCDRAVELAKFVANSLEPAAKLVNGVTALLDAINRLL